MVTASKGQKSKIIESKVKMESKRQRERVKRPPGRRYSLLKIITKVSFSPEPNRGKMYRIAIAPLNMELFPALSPLLLGDQDRERAK